MKPIQFPKDELPHPCTVEWWYFNGHLRDARNKPYSFMHCLFRFNLKTLRDHIPILPDRVVHFSHGMVSDITQKIYYPHASHLALTSPESFTKPLLWVDYGRLFDVDPHYPWAIHEVKPFTYQLVNDQLDLTLTAVKKPVLVGGTGSLKLGKRHASYYALTRLETKGTLQIKGKTISVAGESWTEHIWTSVQHLNAAWVWFSIQLTNHTELVCFDHRAGGSTSCYASLSYPDNRHRHMTKFDLVPEGPAWKSPQTGATYQLGWRIAIPSAKLDIHIRPKVTNQEMAFLTPNYWEGAVAVEGTCDGKRVFGHGFLEIVGRKSNYLSATFFKDKLFSTAGESVGRAGALLSQWLNKYNREQKKL